MKKKQQQQQTKKKTNTTKTQKLNKYIKQQTFLTMITVGKKLNLGRSLLGNFGIRTEIMLFFTQEVKKYGKKSIFPALKLYHNHYL